MEGEGGEGGAKELVLVSVAYDGPQRKAVLKFFDPSAQKIVLVPDYTGHEPYCLTDLPPEEVLKIGGIVNHPGFSKVETVKKHDPLADRDVLMTVVFAKDPLSIGGRPSGCIRDLLPRAWEANIRYELNYIYDTGLQPGSAYEVGAGSPPSRKVFSPPAELLDRMREKLRGKDAEYVEAVKSWIELLSQPIPEVKMAALDIEVLSSSRTRIPDPSEADEAVASAAILGTDGRSRFLLLNRPGMEPEEFFVEKNGSKIEPEYFEDEAGLLGAIFEELERYPFLVTFNGDNFDLVYLHNRAKRLGMRAEETPITLGRDYADLKEGIHIDLYKFLFNRSVQIYAFNNAYKEVTLDAVGEALLGLGKVKGVKPIPEMSYREIAEYCLRDAEITLGLATMYDKLLLKLVIMLTRISRMPVEEVVRHSVSAWIRSLFIYDHRARGYLVPRPEDIQSLKGGTVTRAIIKGKKYLGAIVLEPVSGVHFNVVVMDFASLYPSVIMTNNLSYETVRCPHQECRSNRILSSPHWVCTKRRGITSLVIGSLRDLRVNLYSPMSKNPSLPENERKLYDVVQRALKVFLNASYGVMGAEAFSFYCPPLAESVTMLGRQILSDLIDEAKRLGITVVYGDTDSVFLKNPRPEKIELLKEWAVKRYGIDLTVDKNYRYVVFSQRKKNYVGVLEDGSADVKGLVGKKSSTPNFVKNAFFDLLRILGEVKDEEGFERAKIEIKDLASEAVRKLKSGEYKLEDLAFNVMMSRSTEAYTKTTPQHVKVAKQLETGGAELRAGDIISYVKVKGKEGVKPVQTSSHKDIDVEKYMDIIKSTFGQVLDALGIELEEEGKAKKLSDFM
ncbi:MAG: DNA-directed DNA polymerase I [Candidatus Brockarchaeota archaeon]|nr:DNA-directed DNA polymerase I [Candidatus Brockarchaeota archaeon]